MSLGDYLEGTRVFRKPLESFVKLADVELGENPQLWFAKIYGVFEAQHPEVYKRQDTIPSLTFSKQDFVSGYALGAMTVSSGQNLLVFPVIIRDGRLAPFDIVYVDGKLRYADEDYIEALTNPYSPFKGTSSRKPTDGPSLTNMMPFSASGGKTTLTTTKRAGVEDVLEDLASRVAPVSPRLISDYADSGKLSLRKISHTIKDDQLKKIAKQIIDNPMYFVSATNEFKSVIGKIRNITKTASVDDGWYDVVSIQRKDINEYITKKARAGYDGYIENVIDTKGVKKIATSFGQSANDILNTADALSKTSGAVVISKLDGIKNTIEKELSGAIKIAGMGGVNEVTFDTPGLIKSYGAYNVLFDSGEYDTGTVFPLVDWNFKKSNEFLFVGQKYAIQSKMAGQPSSAPHRAPRGEPREGAEGTYVYEKGGRAFAIPPFKVNSHRHTPRGIAIMGRTLATDNLVNLVPTEGIKSIIKITQDNDPEVYYHGAINVYIPAKMDFIPLPPEMDIIIEDPQNAQKVASFIDNFNSKHQVMVRNDGEGYCRLDMQTFPLKAMPDKMASLSNFRKIDRRTEHIPDIYFNLKVAGMTNPRELILGENDGLWKRASLSVIEDDYDWTKEATPNHSAWYAIKNHIPYSDLFKVASSIDDDSTLDELFSINFMNEENIEYFMSNLGGLKKIEAFLSRLLLGARVSGIRNLSEDEIKNTLKGIVEIRKNLGALSRGVETL